MSEPISRLTLVTTVYHHVSQEDPNSIAIATDRILESKEEPYQRRMFATDEWSELDLGWIKKPSLLVLRNDQDKDNPNLLEISCGPEPHEAQWLVYPSEFFQATPGNPHKIFVRAKTGAVRYTIFAVPE